MIHDPLSDLLLVGVGAGLHKLATDAVHRQQLQQAFDQGRVYERQRSYLAGYHSRDAELSALQSQVREPQSAQFQERVMAAIESGVRKALADTKVRAALPIAHPGFDSLGGPNGNGGPHA